MCRRSSLSFHSHANGSNLTVDSGFQHPPTPSAFLSPVSFVGNGSITCLFVPFVTESSQLLGRRAIAQAGHGFGGSLLADRVGSPAADQSLLFPISKEFALGKVVITCKTKTSTLVTEGSPKIKQFYAPAGTVQHFSLAKGKQKLCTLALLLCYYLSSRSN